MADSPKVSIIIPVFNGQYIEDCINSCLNQSLEQKYIEIIVVNDASTDGTAAILAQIQKKSPLSIIDFETNVGPAAARNAGLAIASGEYISFLDADDMMDPHKLEKQLDHCLQNPTIESVITGIDEIDKDGIPIRSLVRPFSTDPNAQVEVIFLDNLHTITSTLFFKRELLNSTGLMNPDLLNLEDMDFALKLIQHSKMFYLPECLTTRRILSTGLSHSVSETIFMDSRRDFYESAIKMYPFLAELERKYWSLNYARLGRILQRQAAGKRARHYHYLSLKQRFNPIAFLGYILSWFPASIQKGLATKVWRSS